MMESVKWVCKQCGRTGVIELERGFQYTFGVVAETVMHIHNRHVAARRDLVAGCSGPYAVNVSPRHDDAVLLRDAGNCEFYLGIAEQENRPDAVVFFIFPIQ